MESCPFLISYTKTDTEWIININIKAKTINLLEENTGADIHDLVLGKAFLDMTPKKWVTKEKIDKLDFLKFKDLCHQRPLSKSGQDNLQN